jgi:hypothetical protein
MSFDSQLIHTCTIERDPSNGEDLRGNAPVDQRPELVYSGPCRLVEKSEKVKKEMGEWTVVTVYKLFVPTGSTFTKRDRVKKIVLEDGALLEDAFTITESLTRRRPSGAFLSISLEKVQ